MRGLAYAGGRSNMAAFGAGDFRGTLRVQGYDFLKSETKVSCKVSSILELHDAIEVELEKQQKRRRGISGRPFKVQWFDDAFDEYKELRDLKPLSLASVGGRVRLVLLESDAPMKTKADWAGQQQVVVRKDSYAPDARQIQSVVQRGMDFNWATSENGAPRGQARKMLTNDVMLDYRQRAEGADTRLAERPGAFMWRFKPAMLTGSACWCARRAVRLCCPCFYNRVGPLTAHVYAHAGEYEEVQRCIRDGRDINERDANGRSVLSIAVMEEHSDIVDLLIHGGADCNLRDANTLLSPLHHAISQGRHRLADRLICAGCELNVRDRAGMTPLMLACQEGVLEAVAMIVQEALFPEDEAKRGLEVVDVHDQTGWTPLHYAAFKGQLEVAEYLIEEGDANQHLKDKTGTTASDLALRSGNGDVASYLDARNTHLHNPYETDEKKHTGQKFSATAK